MASIQQGDITDEETLLSALSGQNASCTWIQSLDAILILGGGVPLAPKEPPVYVQRRCDVVAEIMNALKKEGMEKSLPRVLCLSAGTAHLPQYILPNDGLREHYFIPSCFDRLEHQSSNANNMLSRIMHYSTMGINIVCSISNKPSKISSRS